MRYQRDDVRIRSILLFLEVLLTTTSSGRNALTFGLHAEILSNALLPHCRQSKPSISSQMCLLQLHFLLLCSNPFFLPLKIYDDITPSSNHTQHGLRSRPTYVQLMHIFMVPLEKIMHWH